MERIILHYEGRPGEALAVDWLARTHRAEIVTVTIDCGQPGELDTVREGALAAGAARAHVLDARERFVVEYLLPALQAGILAEAPDLAAALSAPLTGRLLADIAVMEGAGTVAHLARDAPGEADAIAAAVAAVSPSLRVVALDAAGITATAGTGATPSGPADPTGDGNLWTVRTRVPASTAADEARSAFRLTCDPLDAPVEAASLDIEFTAGVPRSVNGVAVGLTELVEIVTTIAGDHGVGRVVRPGHEQTVWAYESPTGTVLTLAHAALEAAVLDEDVRALKRLCAQAYGDLVRRGAWASPAREAIDALVSRVQARVSGTVRLRLCRGACQVVRTRLVASEAGETAGGSPVAPMPAGEVTTNVASQPSSPMGW